MRSKKASIKEYISLKEKGLVYCHDLHVSGPQDIAVIFEELQNSDREKLITISLDQNDNILGTEVVAIGTLNSASVHPRECLKTPLNLNAKKIVLVHNHPSGIALPSRNDISATSMLIEAARLINIEIPYHIVIGTQEYGIIHNDLHITQAEYSDKPLKKYPITEYEPRLNRESSERILLTSPEAVADYIRPFFSKRHQNIYGLFLNTQNNLVTLQLLGNSEKDMTSEKVARLAITANASAFILCGNFKISERLVESIRSDCTQKLQIEMLDNITINLTDNVKPYESARTAGKMQPYISTTTQISEQPPPGRFDHSELNYPKRHLKEECFSTDSYNPYQEKDAEYNNRIRTASREDIQSPRVVVHNELLLKKVEGIELKYEKYQNRMKETSEHLNTRKDLSCKQKNDIAAFLSSEKGARILETNSLGTNAYITAARLSCDKQTPEDEICKGLSYLEKRIVKNITNEITKDATRSMPSYDFM